jgi:hypothetical protein
VSCDSGNAKNTPPQQGKQHNKPNFNLAADKSGKQNQNVADFFSSLLGTSGTV